MEQLKRQKTLRKVFTQYLILFCVLILCNAALSIGLFTACQLAGWVYPANYFENYLESNRELLSAESIDIAAYVPRHSQYAVIDKDGKQLSGDLVLTSQQGVEILARNPPHAIGGRYLKTYYRENTVCVITYRLQTGYVNAMLDSFLPAPDLMSILLFIVLFLVIVFWTAHRLGKLLSAEMEKVIAVTEEIEAEKLGFHEETSRFVEVTRVLAALHKLGESLAVSLKSQWNMEEVRKEQIAALGHDLKTPLTVLRGNLELLKETELSGEQQEYTEESLQSTGDIQNFMQSLMEISYSDRAIQMKPEKLELRDFLDKVVHEFSGLLINKQSGIVVGEPESENLPEQCYVWADAFLLKRAVGNVLSNAIQYGPEKGEIYLTLDKTQLEGQECWHMSIEDAGKGFSREDLQNATRQFYRNDKSRQSKQHYGLGLSITENIVRLHNGYMRLSNSVRLGGAKVDLYIPIWVDQINSSTTIR